MQNHFPAWKNFLIAAVLVIGILYALPNLFGEDPSVQVSPLRNTEVNEATLSQVEQALSTAGLVPKSIQLADKRLLARFSDTETQESASKLLKAELGNGYIVALNLAPTTPGWLRAINAGPMYLGLDLRGGVHFLMEVDMDSALQQAIERYSGDIRSLLRNDKVRYLSVSRDESGINIKFKDGANRAQGRASIEKEFRSLFITDTDAGLRAILTDEEQKEIRKFALAQNITTLRNRVNEIGVSEPIIQQQGDNRIVIQLPGVQDTARAKEILGATATLEYRKVDTEHDLMKAVKSGHAPIGSRLYYERDGKPILLKRSIIVTGDQVVDASSGIEQDSGAAAVYVTLNGIGAKKMGAFTRKNIGQPMAVVYIENKTETSIVDGKKVSQKKKIEEVISVATIQGHFSKRFQTTGLDSPQEARTLSLLLRAGALAAPVDIIEERTVGPSLGQDNIDQGFRSVMVGLLLVLVFMGVYYKTFGLVANVALVANLVLIIAVLSMLGATLTLPGIAGIVLTVGMAVDANVLIFERIKEEISNGNTPQACIQAGYEKAFGTIFDANLTTLIAAFVLFSFGTGPIKGFAVTLSIGILTSMFTAILGTRMIINLVYGNRRIEKLAI